MHKVGDIIHSANENLPRPLANKKKVVPYLTFEKKNVYRTSCQDCLNKLSFIDLHHSYWNFISLHDSRKDISENLIFLHASAWTCWLWRQMTLAVLVMYTNPCAIYAYANKSAFSHRRQCRIGTGKVHYKLVLMITLGVHIFTRSETAAHIRFLHEADVA